MWNVSEASIIKYGSTTINTARLDSIVQHENYLHFMYTGSEPRVVRYKSYADAELAHTAFFNAWTNKGEEK